MDYLDDNLCKLKLSIGRAQLATALDLFIREKDPFSVQCLACGGGEVVEAVAKLQGIAPFSTHIIETQPHLDIAAIKRIRNQYWNAFKHLTDPRGTVRPDQALLEAFDDAQNDSALFVGWLDYQAITGSLPVHAQVFHAWWYALNEDRLTPTADFESIRSVFPGITGVARAEQKRRLRRAIEKWRNEPALLADSRTEKSLHL